MDCFVALLFAMTRISYRLREMVLAIVLSYLFVLGGCKSEGGLRPEGQTVRQSFHLDEIPVATIQGANSLAEAKTSVKQAGFTNVHQKAVLDDIIGRDILGYSIVRHFTIKFHFSSSGTGFCKMLNDNPTSWMKTNLVGNAGDVILDTEAEEIHFCWYYFQRRYGRMLSIVGPGTISGSGRFSNNEVAFWKKGDILISLWVMDGGKWDVIAFNV